ncbi:Putative capsid protein of prophage [Laribacter hongkongensis HLHK9]|uniref:Capsid protein of prophage n=1 Tax=Laribacter hongkongensis (strain HLHK9) TaxID=557598 RepID=C1D847_LARHH|nr:major capsid protein [Laribacter hongkongensis]ACO74637.1 Putative capsid protein of prophage [Laribacter hongkongensis HLHK9]
MDIFATAVLAHVVANLKRPKLFLLNSYFGQEQRETTEEIHFEVEHGRRRIAPFVSPLRAGQIVTSDGRTVTSLKPAYIKDKRQFDANAPMRRAVGEKIGGALSPEQRMQANLARDLLDQVSMVDRRLEWMAAQAMLHGRYVIKGEGYPEKMIDFQRSPKLRIVKGQGARWTDANVNPLDDLQDWALLAAQESGVYTSEVTMDPAAWKAFRSNPHVEKRWTSLNGNINGLTPAAAGDGGKFMGSIDGFDIYTYADWFVDPDDNTEKPFLPAGSVLLSSTSGLEGYRAFGAIRDEKAGYQALPYFSKSWVEEDPAVRWLLMQSAPLVVPYRINASVSATVL